MATDKIDATVKGCNPGPATVYAKISSSLANLFFKHSETTEPTVIAYMVARYALLAVRAERGNKRAAEIAYELADEFAGERR